MESDPRPERRPVSNYTKERAKAAKVFLENKYSQLKQREAARRQGWTDLNLKMQELRLSLTEQQLIKQEIISKEAEQLRQRRKRITVFDFELVSVIGKGAFGEVYVCRNKLNTEVVALKKMSKVEMVNKNQVQHVRAERNVLALANNPWIVELKYSFEDDKSLYLVMEFLQGGDIMNLLVMKELLSPDEARFYIAETILAVESVHKLNYIHRDLKPDNILIDKKGHVKLSDFGLCKLSAINTTESYIQDMRKSIESVEEDTSSFRRSRENMYSAVGTPNYIAPEVFEKQGYNESVDWWSVGTILFEMLVGHPPFFADDPSVVCQKILNWQSTLKIPYRVDSRAADLIRKLVCNQESRLKVDQIKEHPFFEGLDWDGIRECQTPWLPELDSDIDARNFDKFEQSEPFYPEKTERKKNIRKDVNFIGYSYKKDVEGQRSTLAVALEELEVMRR